ncbi:MAG: hypothetical protein NXI31_26925 [bacterium]|nr:hypothetical protein [bacterium]
MTKASPRCKTSQMPPATSSTRSPTRAAIGSGSLVTDPACTIHGSVHPSLAATTQRVHQTDIEVARLGASPLVTVTSEPNQLAIVAAGYRASTPLTTPFGDLWLDPVATFVLGVITLDANGSGTLPLPTNTSVLIGAHLGVQSAIGRAIALTEPAFTSNLPPMF